MSLESVVEYAGSDGVISTSVSRAEMRSESSAELSFNVTKSTMPPTEGNELKTVEKSEMEANGAKRKHIEKPTGYGS